MKITNEIRTKSLLRNLSLIPSGMGNMRGREVLCTILRIIRIKCRKRAEYAENMQKMQKTQKTHDAPILA